jgi:predicted ABC-type ATPase
MRPLMIVVGGPAGSGKSTAFPVSDFGADPFNVDDRAAELNDGSYRDISPEIRARANQECEAFIETHIREGKSFAVETTLRSDITFRQADAARANGFAVELTYVATDNVETNLERIVMRSERGGHAAPPDRLREIYAASLGNLPRALREFDRVEAFDNTALSGRPRLVLVAEHGRITYLAPNPPSWVKESFRGMEHTFGNLESRKAREKPAADESAQNEEDGQG